MTPGDAEQKREHFRIVYPAEANGSIILKDAQFPIEDISQRGIKFSIEGEEGVVDFQSGQLFRGKVRFLFGGECMVKGNVIRIVEDSVILYLEEPIELKIMFDEHRHVIQTYGESKE